MAMAATSSAPMQLISADRTLEFFQVVELLKSTNTTASNNNSNNANSGKTVHGNDQDQAFAKAVNQLAFHTAHVRFDVDSLENHFKHGAALTPPGTTEEQKVITIKTSLQQLRSHAASLLRHHGGTGTTQAREHREAVRQRILDDLKQLTQRFTGMLEQHAKRSRSRRSRFSRFGPDVSGSFDVANLRNRSRLAQQQPQRRPAPGAPAAASQYFGGSGPAQPPPSHQYSHSHSSARHGSRPQYPQQPAHAPMATPPPPLSTGAAPGGMRRRMGGRAGSMMSTTQPTPQPQHHAPQLAAGAMGLGLMTQDAQLIPRNAYDQEQANDVKDIENTIVEMGSMFGQVRCTALRCAALRRVASRRVALRCVASSCCGRAHTARWVVLVQN